MRKNRTADLLLYFIKQYPNATSTVEAAEALGISSRQVKNYINQINLDSAPNNLLQLTDSNTYIIRSDFQDLSIISSIIKQHVYSPKERMYTVISKLLLSSKPINAFDLSDELFISKSTLDIDINKARKVIINYNLTLSSDHDELILSGEEKDKRKLTSYLITNTKFLNLLTSNQLEYVKESYQTNSIKTFLTEIFEKFHVYANDFIITNFVLHLIVTIDRILSGFYINDITLPDNFVSKYFELTQCIVSFIEKSYGIKFTQSEIDNLLLFISYNLPVVDYRLINENNKAQYLSSEVNNLSNMLINQVCEYYFLETFDDIFMSQFRLHLSNLLNRARQGYSIKNPMTFEIKNTYPLIYDIAVFMAKNIEDHIQITINQDEITFIALHIGSYLERSNQIKSKISCLYITMNYYNHHYSNIEKLNRVFLDSLDIRYSISISDFDIEHPKVDLIISEVELYRNDTIVISPFVTEKEIDTIRNQIKMLEKQLYYRDFKQSFIKMFSSNLFFTNIEGNNKFELISNILSQIDDNEYYFSEFKNEVIRRENLSSTAIFSDIAIPHAISQYVKKSFISFAVGSKRYSWDQDGVRLIIIIGIAYADRKNFRTVFNQLVEVFSIPANIIAISQSKTYQEVVDYINNIVETYLL